MASQNHHVQFNTNNNNGFETNFDDNFGEQVNYPSTTTLNSIEQEEQHQPGLIAGSEDQDYYNNTTTEQVYYTESPSLSVQSQPQPQPHPYTMNNNTMNNNTMNNNTTNSVQRNYIPSIIPEDIRHQYGINALTLDQIHRAVFVSVNSPLESLSVQELSNFFSFCGSVEKIIMVDDLNGAVVCLESNESFSTSLLLNEMKLNDRTTLYIFNLCDLLAIPRKKTTTTINMNNNNQLGSSSSYGQYEQYNSELTTPSSQLAIQGLFQEGFIQSRNLFEQLKSKAIKLDEENDISKKVQHSLNYSKDQWIRFAKQMNDNVENVKLTFVPIRESFNLQTVSARAELINTQTQQYFSYIKTKAKEIGKDLNEKIKQQDQKTQFTAKIKDMNIEQNLSKAGEAVAKNWTAMTSFLKDKVQKVSSSTTTTTTTTTTNGNINSHYGQQSNVGGGYNNSNRQLPPLPNKTVKHLSSLEEDDSMWSGNSLANQQEQQQQSMGQYSLDNGEEEDDFPVEYQTSTTNTNFTTTNSTQNNQPSADSFFD